MNKYLPALLIAAALLAPRVAFGHGDPIFITRDADGRLETDSLIYRTEPEDIGGGALLTGIPGLSVPLGNSTVPNGAQLAVSVLSSLHFSTSVADLATPVDDGSLLYIDTFGGDHHEAGGDTEYLTPLTVGAYATPVGEPSEWHKHAYFTLSANSIDSGAYGVLLQIMSPNHPEILPSPPIALIFNYGLSENEFADVGSAMGRLLLSTGDLNFDGIVDIVDLTIVAVTWQSTDLTGDANHDGRIDISDITLIANKWQDTIGPGPAGYFPPPAIVPEPSGLILGAVGIAMLAIVAVGRQRRQHIA